MNDMSASFRPSILCLEGNTIGSTGYEAIKMGRRFIGFELKESYYNQTIGNMKNAEKELKKPKQTELNIFEDN